jgi:hypothetical protein
MSQIENNKTKQIFSENFYFNFFSRVFEDNTIRDGRLKCAEFEAIFE